MIPQPFIDNLITQCDLVELIDSYVPLKKAGHDYTACCPFHHEKTPSFYVIPKKQFYHCFGCGANGNAISFIMQHQNQSFIDAIHTLASRLGIPVPVEKQQQRRQQQGINLYETLTRVTQYYQDALKTENSKQAIDYLIARGIDGKIAKHYQLGYAPEGWHTLEQQFPALKKELLATGMLIQKEGGHHVYDRYRHRIMFPIHDRQGRLIGFGGRAIDAAQKPKYLNSPETVIFQKSHELYGLYQVLQLEKTPAYILVVEGYMDVIALAQHGVPMAVAALGTAFGRHHIQLLSKYTKKIVCCFDGDQAGITAAHRALEHCIAFMHLGLDVQFMFLPPQHDPDSLIREEGRTGFLKRLKQTTPLMDFFEDTLTKSLDLSTISGKTQLLERAKPHLNQIPDSPFRHTVLELLARLTRIESMRIETMSQRTARPHTAMKTPDKTIRRTPLRLAIAIVLQQPTIFYTCQKNIDLKGLHGKLPDILYQLLKKLSETQLLTTGQLIESLRDHPEFEAFNKLTIWQHHIPDNALEKEFMDIIDFLCHKSDEKEIQHLITKSKREGLNDTEKHQLQNLLRERARR